MSEEMPPQDSQEEPEIRQDTRVSLVAPVEIEDVADKSTESTFTANVSLEGLFVLSSNPKPVGAKVGFELRIQSDGPSVKGFAEVRWIRVRDEGPGRPAGMGLYLTLLVGEEGQKHLRQGIADAIKAGGLEGDPVPAPALWSSPEAMKALASAREPKSDSEDAAPRTAADRVVRQQTSKFEYGMFAHRSATLLAKRKGKKALKASRAKASGEKSFTPKRWMLYGPIVLLFLPFLFVFLFCPG